MWQNNNGYLSNLSRVQSLKQTAKELGCSYHKILKVISHAEFAKYRCTTLLPQARKTYTNMVRTKCIKFSLQFVKDFKKIANHRMKYSYIEY